MLTMKTKTSVFHWTKLKNSTWSDFCFWFQLFNVSMNISITSETNPPINNFSRWLFHCKSLTYKLNYILFKAVVLNNWKMATNTESYESRFGDPTASSATLKYFSTHLLRNPGLKNKNQYVLLLMSIVNEFIKGMSFE